MARALYEGRATLGEGRGTASQNYRRFAKAGVPGYVLEDENEDLGAPEDLEYLLVWYGDIRNRGARGQRYEPILLSEIVAYEHFLAKLDIEMTAFDWEMIFRLDWVWQDCIPKETPPPRRGRR